MFGRKKKAPPKHPTPPWMVYLMVGFLAYAALTVYRGTQRNEDGELREPQLALENYPVLADYIDVDRWQRMADPGYGMDIEVEERVVGSGDVAACGQTVRVAIAQPETTEQSPIDIEVPAEPITFAIGDGSVTKAWDRAVRGMKVGGVRLAAIGLRWFDPEIQHPNMAAPIYELRLQELSPRLPDGALGLQVQRVRSGVGVPVSCGEPIEMQMRVFDAAGELIYENPPDDVHLFMLGDGSYGHGIDRAMVGARPGEIRRVSIPLAYQNASQPLAFPKGEIAIVEVQRMPYKDTVARMIAPLPPEQPDEKEEPIHEPDR